jgi:hypothetical protein
VYAELGKSEILEALEFVPMKSRRMIHVFMVLLGLSSCLTAATLGLFDDSQYREYVDGEPVLLKVSKIFSRQMYLPHSYYDLPICKPETIIQDYENIGQILSGDRLQNSLYEVSI